MRREEHARERLDSPMPVDDLTAALDDIERLDAWFRGYALTLAEIARAAERVPRDRPLVIVDIGGGRGDLAVRCVRWARRQGRRVRVVVVDRDPASLALGARACRRYPEIVRVCGDATALPLREGAADVAVCALTLHHLDPDDAVVALGEMRAVARDAVLVNDLLRSRPTWLLVWLATRLFARHRFSRHDGPLSVRRAYDAHELRALAEKAGLRDARIVPHPVWARLLLVAP
jgi:ubiquinone/menaquinone biosynthesis C-methylase UbiE